MASKSVNRPATNQRKQWLEILAQSAVQNEAGSYKVLLDTNVWYSGVLYGGNAERVIRFCKQHAYIVISDYLIGELLEELKEIKAPYKWRNALEKLLKRLCVLVEPAALPPISRDPSDDPIVAAALAGKCDFIITGDDDLLSLENYKTIKILSVKSFLDLPKVKSYVK